MSDIAIKIEHVSKSFELPHEKNDSIKTGFTEILKRNHKKTFTTQHALRDVSFDIKKGEFFGIVGRNGSGKSTLLKMIAGIYQPTEGGVTVEGKLVPFIELGVGFNPKLTGKENVYLNGAMLGMSRKFTRANYDKIVEFAELEDFMDQRLKNYSSGMQVRLAFACATFAKANILLVDEVLAVGDASFQKKCFDHFRKLKRDRQTVVFVSHNMDSVREFCDRAVLIEKGIVAEIGTADEIADQYNMLFAQNTESSKRIENARRGDKSVTFAVAKTDKKLYTQADKDILISIRLKAHEYKDEIRTGFVVKNERGNHLAGTNSQILHKKIDSVSKGDEIEVRWRLNNILKTGKYTLNVSVESMTNEAYELWDKAATFSVVSDTSTPYLVRPDIDIEIGR